VRADGVEVAQQDDAPLRVGAVVVPRHILQDKLPAAKQSKAKQATTRASRPLRVAVSGREPQHSRAHTVRDAIGWRFRSGLPNFTLVLP
jgi:hypothetical protein